MEKEYTLKVNGTSEFRLSNEEANDLDVLEMSPDSFHILKNNRSYKAEITDRDFFQKTYSVKINSNSYKVVISGELDMLIEKLGLSLGNSAAVNEVHAPMPGLILSVNVKEGDVVKEGDFLLVLEAMKMENTLSAPRDGIVKAVFVNQNETVSKNQVLIEMEP